MELSPATIEHLRDEAYAMLCRRALTHSVQALEQEKNVVSESRPPFGFLAPRQSRNAFESSMQAVEAKAASLHTRLGQVTQLEHWLQGLLHGELSDYLAAASADYRRFSVAGDLIDRWQLEYEAIPELVTAFARDVRNAAEEAASATAARDLQVFAVLRDTALRLEKHIANLDQLVLRVAASLPAEAAAEIRFPALPDFHRVAWVNQLASLPADQLVPEAMQVEQESRFFVAADKSAIFVVIDAARATCRQHEENFLQQYWNQLRAHAQAHYVEDRSIDEVIDDLTYRYVTSDLARRQRALIASDPFLAER